MNSITEKTYETVLQEKILDPLNMKNTGYDHHETIIANRATGYQKIPNTYIKSDYINMSVAYTAGAMYSSVEDLYLWNEALYTEDPLSDKYMDIMFKSFLNNYAYGWRVRKILLNESEDSLKVVSHGGGINGYNALITRLVDDKYLIVLLDNTSGNGPWDLADLKRINILYGKPYEEPKKSNKDK